MIVLFLTTIILMRILQSVYTKKTNLSIPNGGKAYMKYIGISNLFSALFALILVLAGKSGFEGINLQMIIIASVSGMALAAYSFFSIKVLSSGTILLNSMFATAGLIVPCVLGIFMFDETISFMQSVCIVILFASIFMMVDSSKKVATKISKKTIFYLIGVMLSNGVSMFCQKLFGELQPHGNVSLFSMITFFIPTVLILCAIPFVSEEETEAKALPKKLIGYAMILAFAVFVIQQLVTLLTPILSSAVLFTFVNGGAVVVSAVVGAVAYNEKVTVKSVVGIVLGIATMIGMKIF